MIGSERRENSGCERRILRDVWKRILTDLGDIWYGKYKETSAMSEVS